MDKPSITANDIYCTLRNYGEMEEHLSSLAYHAKRYERLVNTVSSLVSHIDKNTNDQVTILDVGPWWQTELFRKYLKVHVNTLGLGENPPIIDKPRSNEHYFQQDLNLAINNEYRNDIPPHHIIVMAEVIEHLTTAPTHILKKIKKFLHPDGFLVLTTPNAVALRKRIKMIKGKVPYNLISEDPIYPSHFREYTIEELTKFAHECGFSCLNYNITNDWDWRFNPAVEQATGMRNIKRKLSLAVNATLFPETWKESILMVLARS